MKTMRKTRISLALAAALTGVGASMQVAAVNLSQDNIGDVVIYPYYTVRDGWTTDFVVINTSGSTVVAKVRFHEARNSRDVLDFTVVLSPKDIISGWVEEGPTGPRVRFPDNAEATCIVPTPDGRAANGSGGHLDFKNLDYMVGALRGSDHYEQDVPGNTNARINDIDRAREGYFTVIEEGAALDEKQPVAVAAKHGANGVPASCADVNAAFAPANIVATYKQFGRNLNALKGNYAITNVAKGDQAGGTGIHLANFASDNSLIYHTLTSFQAGQALVDAALPALDPLSPTSAVALLNAAQTGVKTAADQCVGTIIRTANNTYTVVSATISLGGEKINPVVIPDTAPNTFLGSQCDGNAGNGETAGVQGNIQTAITNYNAAVVAAQKAEAAYELALNLQLSPANNLIAAQNYPGDIYPTLDSGDTVATMLVDGLYEKTAAYAIVPAAGANAQNAIKLPFPWPALYGGHFFIRGVDAVTALLMKSSAMNEWASNSFTGAKSDMVLTSPTKSFYTDLSYHYKKDPHWGVFAPAGVGLFNVVGDAALSPFTNTFVGQSGSCDTVGVGLWNRDELAALGKPVDSSPHIFPELCWESNVIPLSGESVLKSKVLVENVDPTSLLGGASNATLNGWIEVKMDADLDFTGPSHYHAAFPGVQSATTYLINYTWPIPVKDGNGNLVDYDFGFSGHGFELDSDLLVGGELEGREFWVQTGMPYIGFVIKQRNFQSGDNYGSIFDNSYRRGFDSREAWGGQIPDFECPFGELLCGGNAP